MTKALSFISDKWLLYVFLCLLWPVVDSNTTLTPNVMPRSDPAPTTTKPTTPPPPQRPGNVENVDVTARTESSISLTWNKVNNIPTYYIQYEGKNNSLSDSSGDTVSYEAAPLTAGTKYTFTIFTVSNGLSSTGTTKEASTRPRNAENFMVVSQTEKNITLQWKRVENSLYILKHQLSPEEFDFDIPKEETEVIRTINDLENTTEYRFTLFTEFDSDRSSGANLTAYTAPPNPVHFELVGQNERSITLRWRKVGDLLKYRLEFDGRQEDVPAAEGQDLVTYTVDRLTHGTKYDFSLFTMFENVKSSGVNLPAATAPLDTEEFNTVGQNERSITLQWTKVGDLLEYRLEFDGRWEDVTASEGQDLVTHIVDGLTNGTKYEFSLFTVFENVKSSGVNHTAVTAPVNTDEFKQVEQNETSITLQWTQVDNILSYTLKNGPSLINISASEGNRVTISGLTNTTEYNFTLYSVFENVRSSGVDITAYTAPPNTDSFYKINQAETNIILQWEKVGAILNYLLVYNGKEMEVPASEEHDLVGAAVSDLESGTKYNFTVSAVFKNIKSSGRSLLAATKPSKVASVSVADRSVDSVTLKWPNPKEDWDYILRINETEFQVPGSKDAVIVLIPNLTAGTKYTFTVTTEFFELTSSAYEDFTVTQIDCEKQLWYTSTSSITGTVNGLVSHGTAFNGSHSHNVSVEGKNVSVSGLYPGATYEIFLTYKEEAKSFDQCTHKEITNPEPTEARCKYAASGYSVHIAWDTPGGVWTAVEVITPKSTQTVSAEEGQHVEISGFQPANTYKVTVTTISGNKKSLPYAFSCATDPRGVIAGSVMGVLIFVILVVVAVVIVRKRPEIISKNPFTGGSKDKKKKSSAIPVEKFPDHFYQLGMDENRGFSLEYESLMPVGTEQTLKAASLPENKPRNRFSNVLPYDWCRVKLSSSDGASDYINANHMPGYNSSREYIATQGPLPSTVNDFWRMIWEQRVKGIVMVTNCKESGKTKCEQYWPEDRNPCIYGQLSVTITSEQKEFNWTLREFTVRHNNSSEQRTVKHFHFTAWPDHGVPQGTEVLIQFRGLVRQHIEREGTGAPTVVHCSAGVGRTGTIMALDVLLQQLERERAVGINAFVHKMRLNRPHMVQTESQYIFLHQCIMDILQQNERPMENIYENDEMFYANATALREFQKNGKV